MCSRGQPLSGAERGDGTPPVVEMIGRHSHLELYLEEVMIRVETGAAIVVIKKFDGVLLANPSPHLRINTGETLVAIGTREQLRRFAALTGATGTTDEEMSNVLTGSEDR
jgi:uncharacterized protein with PhoU and TrkA domain